MVLDSKITLALASTLQRKHSN